MVSVVREVRPAERMTLLHPQAPIEPHQPTIFADMKGASSKQHVVVRTEAKDLSAVSGPLCGARVDGCVRLRRPLRRVS
jgi:hypothetical protein